MPNAFWPNITILTATECWPHVHGFTNANYIWSKRSIWVQIILAACILLNSQGNFGQIFTVTDCGLLMANKSERHLGTSLLEIIYFFLHYKF